MREKILILTVATLLISCSDSNIKEPKFLGTRGNPKFIKETAYNAIEKFGEVVEKDVLTISEYEFNVNGNIKKVMLYNEDGDLFLSMTNVFKDGECVETESYNKYSNSTVTSSLKEKTSNNETWERKTSEGKITTSFRVFDRYKITTFTKDSEQNTISKEEQIRDSKGNLIELKVFDKEKVTYWYKSTFDVKSQEIEKKVLTTGYDEGIYTYRYESFDTKGNWTRKIEYKDGEVVSLTIRQIEY